MIEILVGLLLLASLGFYMTYMFINNKVTNVIELGND